MKRREKSVGDCKRRILEGIGCICEECDLRSDVNVFDHGIRYCDNDSESQLNN